MLKKKLWVIIILAILCMNLLGTEAFAAPGISLTDNGITIQSTDDTQEISNSIKLLLILTVLSVLPSILIMMTSFTRIIIVLSFLRNSMGTQQTPPNQVVIGLALFLTFFLMSPVMADINQNALVPFTENRISLEEAIDTSEVIIKNNMLKYTRDKDLALFASIAEVEPPEELTDLP